MIKFQSIHVVFRMESCKKMYRHAGKKMLHRIFMDVPSHVFYTLCKTSCNKREKKTNFFNDEILCWKEIAMEVQIMAICSSFFKSLMEWVERSLFWFVGSCIGDLMKEEWARRIEFLNFYFDATKGVRI